MPGICPMVMVLPPGARGEVSGAGGEYVCGWMEVGAGIVVGAGGGVRIFLTEFPRALIQKQIIWLAKLLCFISFRILHKICEVSCSLGSPGTCFTVSSCCQF